MKMTLLLHEMRHMIVARENLRGIGYTFLSLTRHIRLCILHVGRVIKILYCEDFAGKAGRCQYTDHGGYTRLRIACHQGHEEISELYFETVVEEEVLLVLDSETRNVAKYPASLTPLLVPYI